jgi:uncharacterized protein
MKIVINQIPPEGLSAEDTLIPQKLNLESKDIEFTTPIYVKAKAVKITNALTVDMELKAKFNLNCSRCLEKVGLDLDRKQRLNFLINPRQDIIDLDEDIRQELILNVPLKPLCSADCKGLCPECGKNLNQGGCSCGAT